MTLCSSATSAPNKLEQYGFHVTLVAVLFVGVLGVPAVANGEPNAPGVAVDSAGHERHKKGTRHKKCGKGFRAVTVRRHGRKKTVCRKKHGRSPTNTHPTAPARQEPTATLLPPPSVISCTASTLNPTNPPGYEDKTDPGDYDKYRPATEGAITGNWVGLAGAFFSFTTVADCTYTTHLNGAGTWKIQGDYVVFDGPLAGYCNGHGRLVQRSSLQMDFYCNTPDGINYFAFEKEGS